MADMSAKERAQRMLDSIVPGDNRHVVDIVAATITEAVEAERAALRGLLNDDMPKSIYEHHDPDIENLRVDAAENYAIWLEGAIETRALAPEPEGE